MALPRNEEEAKRRVEQALAPWRDQLAKGRTGGYARVFMNAVIAFHNSPEWAGKLRYDAFYQRTMLFGQTPWSNAYEERVWYPDDDLKATVWLQEQGVMINDDMVNKAIELVARDFTYHPVLDYLKTLKWDGQKRLDLWLTYYLGVDLTEYSQAVGAKFLISAIARVMQPGCKADCALILEGRQGIKKSTALRTMFGRWFTDEISELGSKDAAMQMAGVWGIELAEMEGMNRSETSRTKAALSRGTDRYRPPWGKRVVDQPRQCVFMGSCNHNTYLRDETGGRRFWPVVCGTIDINALATDRDQLWAEALARFTDGEVWWLDTELLTDKAAIEQKARRAPDPWDDDIEDWAYTKDSVTPTEFLLFIGIEKKDQDQRQLNRVAASLQAIGYERKSIRLQPRSQPRKRYALPGKGIDAEDVA